MKKVLTWVSPILLLALLVGVAWVVIQKKAIPFSNMNTNLDDSNSPVVAASATGHHILFTVNTQEFIYAGESVATLNKIIDLHEEKNIPVDIYLNHAILQTYEQQAPELLERMITSPVVAVSYHMRPPLPYFSHFDWLGLGNQSPSEVKSTIERYESHAIDFTTGETTDEAGGYQHLKEILGYAPPIVGFNVDPNFAQTVLSVYQDQGASFVVEHRGSPIKLGETKFGVPIRPEDQEIILTEYADQPCSQVLSAAMAEVKNQEQSFINLKVHDNDFIATRSAWLSVYLPNNRPTTPPFDLSLGETSSERLSAEEQDLFWNQYAECVEYAAQHTDQVKPINAFDLQEMLSAESSITPLTNQMTNQTSEGVKGPTIFASVITHIEEPGPQAPNFVDNESAFWEWREGILQFATMLHDRGVAYNFQSDWNFLLAIQTHDHGTDSTNGKNLIKYLKEDLDAEIDPHAHGRTHNYADVAYLISQLGVEPSHLVGGYLVFPTDESELEKLWSPMTGKYYDYTWQADTLWGGGSPNHIQDYTISGVWKPKDAEHFIEHSEQAPLPTIGSYTGDWDGVEDLLGKAAAGSLDENNIFTASIMVGSSVFLDDQAVADFEQQLQTVQDEIDSGSLVLVYLRDVMSRWYNEYDTKPNIYNGFSSATTTPTSNTTAPTLNQSINKGQCGDGICGQLEQQLNKCPEDCQ